MRGWFRTGPAAPCFNNLDINSPFGDNKRHTWLPIPNCPYSTTNPPAQDRGNHIESFVMLGPGTGTGAVQLYALDSNGEMWRSTGDSSCVTNPIPANYFTSWQKVEDRLSATPISFIAGVKDYPFSNRRIYGVSRSNSGRLREWVNNAWTTVGTNDPFQLFAGDAQLSIALRGSSPGTKDLILYNGAGTSLPPIPANVTLANQSGGGENIPFYRRGYGLPIATNFRNAYFVAASADGAGQNIYRSTRASIGSPWSAWAIYPTGTLPSSVQGDPLPWSVVDASSFRGVQGEIFVIGGAFHPLRYVP